MRGSGRTIRPMGRANFGTLMVTCLRGNGKMIKYFFFFNFMYFLKVINIHIFYMDKVFFLLIKFFIKYFFYIKYLFFGVVLWENFNI